VADIDRRKQVITILAEADGFNPEKLEEHDYQQQADRLLALWASVDEESYAQRRKIEDMDYRFAEGRKLMAELTRLFEEYRQATEEEIEELGTKLKALQADEEKQREDLEDLQNQKQDLEEKVKALEKALTKEREMVQSLRFNGARHWFAFDHQKMVDGVFVDFCSVCTRDRGHPAHFQSGSKYLDSRDVEKAAQAAQSRLEAFLRSGLSMGPKMAPWTVLELLAGLPGIPEGKKQEEKTEQYCTCGAPKSNHPYRHPFNSGPPNDRGEGER
jgi:DNA repair exonuclease SbcCD ATPase subunit